MTRTEFEQAKHLALCEYMENVLEEYRSAETKRKQNSAKRRYNLAIEKMELIKKEGFWNVENETAYKLIYKHIEPGPNVVSAL